MNVNQLFFKYAVVLPVSYLRGERIRHYIRILEQTQWASREDIQSIQMQKLRELIDHAAANVPHFRTSLDHIADRSEIRPGDFGDLPFLTKADLRTHQSDLLSVRPPTRMSKKTTGGSTGQAVTVRKSREATAQESAAQYRGFGWAGIEIGARQGRFWGMPMVSPGQRLTARLGDWICNRRRCSAFAFTEKDMAEYTRLMNRFRPDYLYGYVSMLCRYAEFLESGAQGINCNPRAIVTTAEQLTNYHRVLLNRVFDAPVFNEYGCGEIGTIAHQCERGSMHVNAENMLIEILDGHRPCAKNEVGEIVVTELNNYAMPLIRYRLGDYAAISNEPCACGRNLPVLSEIAGREYDLVYNREGEMFHGEFFMYIFEEVKRLGMGVGAFRVVQDSYEHFTVFLRPEEGYSEKTDTLIRDRIRSGYGSYAEIDFVHAEEMEREPSGKMRLIVGMDRGYRA